MSTFAVYSGGKRREWCRECARFHGKLRCPRWLARRAWEKRRAAEFDELIDWLGRVKDVRDVS
jgi:hypothetical protein